MINEKLTLDRKFLENLLCITFFSFYWQNKTKSYSISTSTYKPDIALHPEIASIMTKVLLLHITRLLYDNYKRYSRSFCSPYRSRCRSPHRHYSRQRYRSRSYSRDNIFPRYTSSFRTLSRPRDSRYSRPRSHSITRNKLNTIQPQTSNDPINFEVDTYVSPYLMTNAFTTTSWFHPVYCLTPTNQNHYDFPSRLEFWFHLYSSASISLLALLLQNSPKYDEMIHSALQIF